MSKNDPCQGEILSYIIGKDEKMIKVSIYF